MLNLRCSTARGGAARRSVMDLVPAQDRLVAEVNISPSTSTWCMSGCSREIRLPAFKQRWCPICTAMSYLRRAGVTSTTHARHLLRAHILIVQEQLDSMQGVQLVPGMRSRPWCRSAKLLSAATSPSRCGTASPAPSRTVSRHESHGRFPPHHLRDGVTEAQVAMAWRASPSPPPHGRQGGALRDAQRAGDAASRAGERHGTC